ncbi:twin-arginine translocase TatA/TatE family subunit [Nocardioides coralli]|uniref:twin-arginine translocase TatA/TatE family subunit n=1 Tax=Nocardioides coralli TaxID=2872154 RepID=UPI001CA42B14|nr:twin-arginine translocase TatA/TatE family subunit [Nocardioides coralli]QZY27672.1 twin-arginine translocase TatA/TatE family subunit [Nocardioides coralli]
MHADIAVPGGWELILIVLVIVLFFGAAKLPELARGSGRALRIFKAETKGLGDDDEATTPEQKEIESRAPEQEPTTTDDPIVRERHDGTTS